MEKKDGLLVWVSSLRPVWVCCLLSALLHSQFNLQANPPPTGVAPVLVPSGGFAIEGNLQANTPTAGVGDWLPGPVGSGGSVLNARGAPLNPTTTFHFTDAYINGGDNTFVGGLKWLDDPNGWGWTTGSASGKTDITN